MLAWIKRIPTGRKVALFMAGALLTLVFDVVVAHVLGKPGIKWTQAVPIVYGLLGAPALAIAALALGSRPFLQAVRIVGGAGVLVGTVGAVLHTVSILDSMSGEAWTG